MERGSLWTNGPQFWCKTQNKLQTKWVECTFLLSFKDDEADLFSFFPDQTFLPSRCSDQEHSWTRNGYPTIHRVLIGSGDRFWRTNDMISSFFKCNISQTFNQITKGRPRPKRILQRPWTKYNLNPDQISRLQQQGSLPKMEKRARPSTSNPAINPPAEFEITFLGTSAGKRPPHHGFFFFFFFFCNPESEICWIRLI
jgi:hypothetical protein